MKNEQLKQLFYEALETELGGVLVYETALHEKRSEERMARIPRVASEPRSDRARSIRQNQLDPEAETPGRQIERHIGQSLIKGMEMTLSAGNPAAARLVAAECVVGAETY